MFGWMVYTSNMYITHIRYGLALIFSLLFGYLFDNAKLYVYCIRALSFVSWKLDFKRKLATKRYFGIILYLFTMFTLRTHIILYLDTFGGYRSL